MVDQWPERGSYNAPELDLPGVRVSLAGWWDRPGSYVWIATVCGHTTQANSLPEVLRSLASMVELETEVRERQGKPPPWWTRWDGLSALGLTDAPRIPGAPDPKSDPDPEKSR